MLRTINVDVILQTFNDCGVRYMLIGGMNFSIRHAPYTTEDIDLWIEDSGTNRAACQRALAMLDAEWGKGDEDWGPVSEKPDGWLMRQGVFSLYSPHGAIDIFRAVTGLADWESSFAQVVVEQTAIGTKYYGLSDADMLRCQMALKATDQKAERIRTLRDATVRRGGTT